MKEDLMEILFKYCDNDGLSEFQLSKAFGEIMKYHIEPLQKYKDDTKGMTVVDCKADEILHRFWK
jgi:hypothetical protein